MHLLVIGSPAAPGPRDSSSAWASSRPSVSRRVIDDAHLRHLYAEAEVAVVPSLYEGFSLPAVEAMACGVPLVATTGGALPEVAGPSGETCLLVPPGDPDALADMILRALGDADLRSRIGAAGRARVLDRFTWRATVGRRTAELYRPTSVGRTLVDVLTVDFDRLRHRSGGPGARHRLRSRTARVRDATAGGPGSWPSIVDGAEPEGCGRDPGRHGRRGPRRTRCRLGS